MTLKEQFGHTMLYKTFEEFMNSTEAVDRTTGEKTLNMTLFKGVLPEKVLWSIYVQGGVDTRQR